MTTGDAARLPATEELLGAAEPADVLKRLQDSALGLLAGLDRAPRSLRVKADQVEIHLEWPEDGPAGPAGGGVSTAPIASAEPVATVDGTTAHYVTAPMVGVFYRAREPGGKAFVEPGDLVAPGQQVGIIEAMKLMIPVESTVTGRIVEVLVSDAASVEYGDRLFAVEPADS